MFDLKLFLGFLPDEAFQGQLLQTNPYLTALFIGKEEYLQEINHQGKRYLGKHLSSFPTLDQLEDLEKHILSLLHKLAPHYPFAKNPPVLITLSTNGK
jgi:hypothetical protein